MTTPSHSTASPEKTSGRAAKSPMKPASQKTGSGPIGVLGPILAVLLTALGVLLVRDALVKGGTLGGTPWLEQGIEGAKGFAPAGWLIPAGIVVALIGLWLIVTALRPRSRRTLPLKSSTNTFLSTGDLARLASGAARDVDGVLSASSTATRSSVTVSVRGTGDVREQVQRAVTDAVGVVQSPPRVVVRAKTSGEER